MTIARIETFALRIPFARGARPPVDSLLVKVTTDDGCEGWGEAFGFEATPLARRAVGELVAPLCLARTPRTSHRSCARSRRSCRSSAGAAR